MSNTPWRNLFVNTLVACFCIGGITFALEFFIGFLIGLGVLPR